MRAKQAGVVIDDIGKVMRAGPGQWPLMARAVAELAWARLRLGKLDIRAISHSQLRARAPGMAAKGDAALAQRLEWLIPRVARRMPFRADCLVQAMAARRWLAAAGIESVLRLGSRTTPDKGFEAHAWLTVGDLVVTGWDIAQFEQFAEFPLDGASPRENP